jgi:acyl dehydratase
MFPGKWYDEVRVGERFGTSVTVTETHLVLGSGMFGDFNPLHVDEEFASKSLFGGRILHGPFTSALVSAPVGMYFSGTAIAYLEHACRFKKAVKPGRQAGRHAHHRVDRDREARQAEAQGRDLRAARHRSQPAGRGRGRGRRQNSD